MDSNSPKSDNNSPLQEKKQSVFFQNTAYISQFFVPIILFIIYQDSNHAFSFYKAMAFYGGFLIILNILTPNIFEDKKDVIGIRTLSIFFALIALYFIAKFEFEFTFLKTFAWVMIIVPIYFLIDLYKDCFLNNKNCISGVIILPLTTMLLIGLTIIVFF